MAKRLYRSDRERILGGVAGGMADYFDVDVTLVRLAWIILALVSAGLGVFAYIVAWVIMPEAPSSRLRDRSIGGEVARGADGEVVEIRAEGGADNGRQADARSEEQDRDRSSGSGYLIFGIALVGLGFLLLINNLLPRVRLDQYWPALLIFLGALILAGAFRRDR